MRNTLGKTIAFVFFLCSVLTWAEGLLPLPGKWTSAGAHGVKSLIFKGTRIVGMDIANADAKKYDYCSGRALPLPVAGNFIFSAKLDYELKDLRFIGNVHVRLVTAQGGIICATGLRDHWEALPGRIYAHIQDKAINSALDAIPLKGLLDITAERLNDIITITVNGKEILQNKGSQEPVVQIQLFFEEYNTPESLAAEFEFSDIKIESTGIPEGYLAHFQDSAKPIRQKRQPVAVSNKSVMPLPGYWTKGSSKNVSGLTFSGTAVTGLEKNADKAPFFYSADRELLPAVRGDFYATATLDYEMPPAFSGEVHLLLLDEHDGQIAAMGIRDRWSNTDFAHLYASILETGTLSTNKIPLKGTLNLVIRRFGNTISFLDKDGKPIVESSGNTLPVAKVRLYFQEYSSLPPNSVRFAFSDIHVQPQDGYSLGETVREFPVKRLPQEWKLKEISGAEGLLYDEESPFMAITGFEKPNPNEKDSYKATFERDVSPLKGDFTASFDLAWDLPMTFVGEFFFQIVDDKDKIIAEAGLIDDNVKGTLRMGAWASLRKGHAMMGNNKANGTFMIRRTGGICSIFFDDWQLEEIDCSKEPVAKIRLRIKQSMYFHQGEGPNLTEFGKVLIKRISLIGRALQPPAPKYAAVPRPKQWQLGKPIVWYWAAPEMSEELARELADGGWNTAWVLTPHDLDVIYPHGLRGISWMSIDPIGSDNIRRLNLWLNTIRNHPALYGIHCNDEPGGPRMPAAELKVNFMRKYAPELLHFNNMHPLGAENLHLGHEGKPTVAYDAYINEYCSKLYVQLLSFDKYTFTPWGDDASLFANFAMVRKAAIQRDIPMIGIIQACTWNNWRRKPNASELRYLTYTLLAYGAQGISHYVYAEPNHIGGMHDLETGRPTPLYTQARILNREFFAIAQELQGVPSIGAYHTGEIPFLAETLPEDGVFQLEPRLTNYPQDVTDAETRKADGKNFFSAKPPVKGFILGYFGKDAKATHALVVNLDYNAPATTRLTAPGNLQRFAPHQSLWVDCDANYAEFTLSPGGGMLFRLK